MTEHSAVIFVFFFLGEYASIQLICIIMSILYLGGYLSYVILDQYVNNILIEGYVEGTSLGLKGNILVFIFVLVRASLPRIRFDQLMTVC